MLQQGQLAVEIMRSTLDQRRSSVRIHLTIPADLICGDSGQHHIALIRDISTSGAFFYSNAAPERGCNVTLEFVFPVSGKRIKITCHGVVVRVEPSARGGATGIAMEFQRHDLTVLR